MWTCALMGSPSCLTLAASPQLEQKHSEGQGPALPFSGVCAPLQAKHASNKRPRKTLSLRKTADHLPLFCPDTERRREAKA